MTKNMLKATIAGLGIALALAGCSGTAETSTTDAETVKTDNAVVVVDEATGQDQEAETVVVTPASSTYTAQVTELAGATGGILSAADLFTERDLKQNADLSSAVYYTLEDGQDIAITSEGVYVISGTASNVTITVEAPDTDKVQIVLDGATITNDDSPCIYVKSADKVFVTTTEGSTNTLSVTGTFSADGDTNTDAVIFSRDDLVLNGLGTLNISSTDNGVSCKDVLKITGGVLTVHAQDHALEANDAIAIADGTVTLTAGKDGLHAKNEDDNREGWIYICGGTLNVNAADDGLHAVSVLQIDGGTLNVTAAEGMEATWVQINNGSITIQATDDGINGAKKSSAYTACVEINGGVLTVTMGQGDTDGIDSNGNLTITGGEININAQSPFDYDGILTHTGGTITVNGTRTTQITNPFGGGPGGGPGGPAGGGRGH